MKRRDILQKYFPRGLPDLRRLARGYIQQKAMPDLIEV